MKMNTKFWGLWETGEGVWKGEIISEIRKKKFMVLYPRLWMKQKY